MSNGISLTSAMRSNLLSLQSTQSLMATTQNRLATGLKVSSALDNPSSFFQASAMNNRASDLGRLQDGMGLAIKTFEAADKGIKAMTKIAENMAAIAKSALDATTTEERSKLAGQFNELRKQLADTANDSGFNGINLLAGDSLETEFNEDGSSKQSVTGVNYAARNASTGDFDATLDVVGIGTAGAPAVAASSGPDGVAGNADDVAAVAGSGWSHATAATATAAIKASQDDVKAAISELRNQAAVFGSNLTVVKIREDFTKEMINTLKGGADGLTLADQNEEAANLLALNTRQQLSQQALSLATQSEQSILRLLGG